MGKKEALKVNTLSIEERYNIFNNDNIPEFCYDTISSIPGMKDLLDIISDSYNEVCLANSNKDSFDDSVVEKYIKYVDDFIYRNECITNVTDVELLGIRVPKITNKYAKISTVDIKNKLSISVSYNKLRLKTFLFKTWMDNGKFPDRFVTLLLNDEERDIIKNDGKYDRLNDLKKLKSIEVLEPNFSELPQQNISELS